VFVCAQVPREQPDKRDQAAVLAKPEDKVHRVSRVFPVIADLQARPVRSDSAVRPAQPDPPEVRER